MTVSLAHDWDLEMAALTAYLNFPDLRPMMDRALEADDLSDPRNRRLWEVMRTVNADDGGLDIATLIDATSNLAEYDVGGPSYVARVATLSAVYSEPASAARMCRRLREMRHRRLIQQAGEIIRERAADQTRPLGDLRVEVEALLAPVYAADTEAKGWVQLADAADEDLARMEARRSGGPAMDVVPTGFGALDELLGGGIQRTNLVILAARPAMGKSACALQMVLNAARLGHGAGFFSLEMGAAQLARRGVANLAGVQLGSLRTGSIGEDDRRAAYHARDRMKDLPIWIDDDAEATVGALRTKVRALKRLYPDLGLVVVDYLQLLKGARRSGDNRETEVAGMSRALKVLAKSENVAVVCLAQLNRGVEARPLDDRKPKPSDLRESGAIEQDADVILFPYRHGVYVPSDPTLADRFEIIVAKQRDGDLGTVALRWSGAYQRIEAAAERRDRAYDADRGSYY